MKENDYDYEGYSKSLEKVLEGVTKDYWASYIDINRHQVAVGRTYLWVAVALIGIYTAGYEYIRLELSTNIQLVVLGIISFLLAFCSFGICLYAIPARKGYKTIPLKGWGEFSHDAYELLIEKKYVVYPAFLTHLISRIDMAFEFNFKTNQKRAHLLRITSWLLIASFCVALVTTVGAFSQKYNLQTQEVIKMPDENTSDSTQSSSSDTQSSSPAVPKPPPPADIGGTVHTHSEEAQNNSHISESAEKE